MEITLPSGRKIGDHHEPFIIAEVGSNWKTFSHCLLSIAQAKLAGADAVKFQLYDHEALYGYKKTPELPGSLPVEWLKYLHDFAKLSDIEFMCSAFSPELIEAVNPYVNIHKLASAEMCHVRMLERLREIGKPVFMSTGGHNSYEIGKAVGLLGNTPLVLMYCVSAYPAQEIQLDHLKLYRETFHNLVGYSDHSIDVCIIPHLATTEGASVIEKHFNALPEIQSADSAHSLNATQFKRMVETIRGTLKAPRAIDRTDQEKDMILRHNRRLIATKEIKVGELLREGVNFGIYRSLRDTERFLTPFRISEIEGKSAKKEIKIGDAICEGDV